MRRSVFALIAVLAGCTPTSVVENLRVRAADDLECPVEDVNVRDVGAGAYRARGCGKKVVYVCRDTQCAREVD